MNTGPTDPPVTATQAAACRIRFCPARGPCVGIAEWKVKPLILLFISVNEGIGSAES